MVKSFDMFQNIKYNDTKEWELVKGYVKTVQKGEISPLIRYSNFKKYHKEPENKLVGLKLSDGLEVKGVSYRFTGRAIWTHDWANSNNSKGIMKRLNHKHVTSELLLKCVKNGKLIHTRNNSVTYSLTGVCDITINQLTGTLVQCNPK